MLEPYNKVVLDNKELRSRLGWWVPFCGTIEPGWPLIGHVTFDSYYGEYVGMSLDPPRAPIQVSVEEAKNGPGRPCKVCGIIYGSYICDGLPTFSAITVIAKDGEEVGEG